MTIEEYIKCRFSNTSIKKSDHPVYSKFKTQRAEVRLWSIEEAIIWFDSTFPLDIIESIYRAVLAKDASGTASISYINAFNSFSVSRINKKLPFSATNCFLSNSIWAATPKAIVTCRCCGFSTDSPTVRHRMFKKSKRHTLGVDSICKSCHSELTILLRLNKFPGVPIAIKGPYCSLVTTKRCTVCHKVVPLVHVVSNFRRIRWTTGLVDSTSGLEAMMLSMFSSVCLECEQKDEHKPGPQSKHNIQLRSHKYKSLRENAF